MARVTFDVGSTSAKADLPTDERIATLGASDPQLVRTLFDYGRYLLIASSRPGTQPANLQGIWNDQIRPPWSSNYTININTEMNYWPAESANLAELHEPMLSFVRDLSVTGAKTASVNYGARGWVAHHNADLWRQSAPVGNYGEGDPVWALWTMAGPWLSQHLWEHYAFGGDQTYLKERAYPVMAGAAEFCLDWLVDDGRGHLVTAPSTSPEHKFVLADGRQAAVTYAASMDLALIWDLFRNLHQAEEAVLERPRFQAGSRRRSNGFSLITSTRRARFRSGPRTSSRPSASIGTSRICSACFLDARSRRPRRRCLPQRDGRWNCAATAAPAGAWRGRSTPGRGCATAIAPTVC